MRKIIAFILVMMVPFASGEATVEGTVLTYPVDTFVVDRQNPPAGDVFNRTINVSALHDYAIEGSSLYVTLSYTAYLAQQQNGRWQFNVYWNNTLVPECHWSIQSTGGLTQSGTYPFYLPNCQLPIWGGQDNYQFSLVQVLASGSPPAIAQSTASYVLYRTDELVPDMTNEFLEAIIAIAPFIAFLILAVWAERSNEFFLYVLSIVVGLFLVLAMSNDFSSLRFSIVAALLFLALRAAQNRIAGRIQE